MKIFLKLVGFYIDEKKQVDDRSNIAYRWIRINFKINSLVELFVIYMKIIILILTIFFCLSVKAFPIPENGKVKFDIIRKNKVIGNHEIKFIKNDDVLLVETNIDIDLKILFIPAYKFSHQSIETWVDGNFIKIEAHTDFEDEREYFINGYDDDDFFLASGMDGDLKLDKSIIPSNFWNIEVLNQKEIFDTQKGIVRTIEVKNLAFEYIEVNGVKLKCQKFSFNASSNPKDKGPFPEYTLWYDKNNELIKFKFTNWKDDKVIKLVRSNQEDN